MVPVDWVALAGVIGLTARFALKPIVEAVARMRQKKGPAEHLALLEQRMALMEQQQANMESDMGRLLEVQESQEKLLTNQEEGS